MSTSNRFTLNKLSYVAGAVDGSRPGSGISRPRSADRFDDTPKENAPEGPKKKRGVGAKIAKFLFSEVGDFVLGFSVSQLQAGLVLIILVYLVFGALLFSALEASGEEEALAALYDKALTIEVCIFTDFVDFVYRKSAKPSKQTSSSWPKSLLRRRAIARGHCRE